MENFTGGGSEKSVFADMKNDQNPRNIKIP